MRRCGFIVFLLLAIQSLSYANRPATPTIKHVIYVTLDGIRWQDIMENKKQFPTLWRTYANSLTAYGQPGHPLTMEAASIPVSLPSYQTQMTGAVQPCENNECGRVTAQTLPESLALNHHLPKSQIAVFSSWPVIGDALESKQGTVYNSVGNEPVIDPITGQADAIMKKINHLQTLASHHNGNRLDKYTFAHALHYLKKYRPAFLWVSLVNADNEAHDNKRSRYRAYLAEYDRILNSLFRTLKKEKLDKNTMVIITTDHGRGNDTNWITHGPGYPESKQTWAFVYNGKLTPVGQKHGRPYYSTLSIRPTIEAVFFRKT